MKQRIYIETSVVGGYFDDLILKNLFIVKLLRDQHFINHIHRNSYLITYNSSLITLAHCHINSSAYQYCPKNLLRNHSIKSREKIINKINWKLMIDLLEEISLMIGCICSLFSISFNNASILFNVNILP